MSPHPARVAIIGGGPGGLFTAHRLQQRCQSPFIATIYEATPRVGGKIVTAHFESSPVQYEAGAAELYDYSRTGPDPLRQLVADLGLRALSMHGEAVILDDTVIPALDDTRRLLGDAAATALEHFDADAKAWMSPQAYYEADWTDHSLDPRTAEPFSALLARIPDAAARRYVATLVHSDLATEPQRTSAAYGLQNYLMNDPAYVQLYTIDGGIEQLPRAIAPRLSADVRLREPVVAVGRLDDGSLSVESVHGADLRSAAYDFVVTAVPHDALGAIEWRGDLLASAMHRHQMHYDHPAHYLRITMLLDEPFWRHRITDSFFMLDAFDGCCLYDESARADTGGPGVLGWLLAGDAAARLAGLADDELTRAALAALPSCLASGRARPVESRVHRWIGSVNGLPGGVPAFDMDTRHRPEPIAHDNLFVVGDYLFDSTLNGVLDSAEYVVDLLAEEMR